MVSSAEMLAAFRELSNTKQLDRTELYGLLQDGFMAALATKYGPTVQAEVEIDDAKGKSRSPSSRPSSRRSRIPRARSQSKRPSCSTKASRLAT